MFEIEKLAAVEIGKPREAGVKVFSVEFHFSRTPHRGQRDLITKRRFNRGRFNCTALLDLEAEIQLQARNGAKTDSPTILLRSPIDHRPIDRQRKLLRRPVTP